MLCSVVHVGLEWCDGLPATRRTSVTRMIKKKTQSLTGTRR